MTSASPFFNVSGLASGLDTNQIVSQLMAIDRQPEVRWKQQQTVEQARKDALGDVQTRLQNLQSALTSLSDVTTWADTQTVETSAASVATATRTAGAPAGAFAIHVTQLARAAQWAQSSAVTAATGDQTLTLTVGTTDPVSVDVDVADGDSIDTIAAKINSATGTPVYAAVVDGKLYLTGKQTGSDNDIAVTSTGSLVTDLALEQKIQPLSTQYTVGTDPTVHTSDSNTITDAIQGLSITLKSTGDATITVGSSAPNTSTITQKIQDFVDQYNSTVSFIESKLREAKVANPTTDSDRTKGVLNSDAALSGLLSQLREAVGQPISGAKTGFQTLAQVGVSTGAAVGSGTLSQDAIDGKLTLDGDTLSTQLAASLDDVKKLFTNPTGSSGTEGLVQRLNDLLTPVTRTGGTLDSRMQSEDSLITDLQRRQDDLEDRLKTREEALRSQFAQMESTLSNLQAQNSWLSSQIAGLG